MPIKRRNYKNLGEYKMSPKKEAKVERMIAQADEEDARLRVNFRWTPEAVDVVKQAAELMGIPYQTFIKQTVFEHALAIIKDAKAAQKQSRKD